MLKTWLNIWNQRVRTLNELASNSSLVSSGWQDGRLDDCSLIVIQRLFFSSLPLPVLVPVLRWEETASGESACTCHCLSGCLLISLPANDFESDEGGSLAGARRLLQRLTHFFFFATPPSSMPSLSRVWTPQIITLKIACSGKKLKRTFRWMKHGSVEV